MKTNEGRDPVDVAELKRDFEETYGSEEQRFNDWWQHQEEIADREYTSCESKEI